ncbi:MAG: hypothetical protein IT560_08055 [Alphaproteobacteria bacterium]|nr:hypothetical protein [Alphaproteobacteria bacterium]
MEKYLVYNKCREKLAQGIPLEEIIQTLRDGGFGKVETMKALIDWGQASVIDAKRIVHESPTWADVRKRDEEFHSELEDATREEL